MERLAQVAKLIRNRRLGPTEAEIVAATAAGLVTGEQANWLLERMMGAVDDAVREREVPCGAYLEEEVDGETVEEAALRQEVGNLLLRVLNDLPARERQCVELHYYHDLTQEQIAERVGVAQSTVSRLLSAARLEIACIISPPIRRITYGGNFWAAMMALSYSRQPSHPPSLWPYELAARCCVGTRQAANGVWVSVTEDRLDEYIRRAFGSGTVKPWRY